MMSDTSDKSVTYSTSETATDERNSGQKMKFTFTYDDLPLPADVHTAAQRLWNVFEETATQELQSSVANPLKWYTCWVYVASIDSRLPYGMADPQAVEGVVGCATVTVSQLLQAAQMPIGEFFQLMSSLRNTYAFSEAVKHHLLSTERKYLITGPIYCKFERIFSEVFLEDEKPVLSNGHGSMLPPGECYEARKRFCWVLFIHAKGRAAGAGDLELVRAFHLLLACLNYVLRMTPAFQLCPPFDATRLDTDSDVTLLQQLWQTYSGESTLAEVTDVQESCLDPVIQDLPQIEGAIDEEALLQMCRDVYQREGDIDELNFLHNDATLLPPLPQPEVNNNSDEENAPQPADPAPPAIYTPVRAALNAVQQLQLLLGGVTDQPSTQLLKYFNYCSVDPVPSVQTWVEELRTSFVSEFVALQGEQQTALARQRFHTGLRLYYSVMEALLKQEEERLSQQDFGRLLHTAQFHRCLLGCAMEVVITTYSFTAPLQNSSHHDNVTESRLQFPWILNVFDLKAYDFFKVLESFIRAQPKLSKDIIRHLQRVETHILQKTAWQSGSPVFETFNGDSKISPSGAPPGDRKDTTPADLYLSPMRTRNTTTPPPASAASALESPMKKRSMSFSHFINKVCRLAYNTLQSICSMMEVPNDLQHKIWTCLEYAITRRPDLMRDRHLDQIIMCSIYAICKVVDKEIKFKTIVSVYRELPYASQQTYKEVLIAPQEYDSIIAFYNRIFMQNLKPYIIQFSSRQVPCLSPGPKLLSSSSPLQASPVFSLRGRPNFYVSPMKDSPFKLPRSPVRLTPVSQQLYCFGEGARSADKLRSINAKVRNQALARPEAAVAKKSRSSKRLSYDMAESQGDDDFEELAKKIPKRTPAAQSSSLSPSIEQNRGNKS